MIRFYSSHLRVRLNSPGSQRMNLCRPRAGTIPSRAVRVPARRGSAPASRRPSSSGRNACSCRRHVSALRPQRSQFVPREWRQSLTGPADHDKLVAACSKRDSVATNLREAVHPLRKIVEAAVSSARSRVGRACASHRAATDCSVGKVWDVPAPDCANYAQENAKNGGSSAQPG